MDNLGFELAMPIKNILLVSVGKSYFVLLMCYGAHTGSHVLTVLGTQKRKISWLRSACKSLALMGEETDFRGMKAHFTTTVQIPQKRMRKKQTEVRVLAAPDMLDREYTVARDPEESDASYRSRCDLFGLLLESAKRG